MQHRRRAMTVNVKMLQTKHQREPLNGHHSLLYIGHRVGEPCLSVAICGWVYRMNYMENQDDTQRDTEV